MLHRVLILLILQFSVTLPICFGSEIQFDYETISHFLKNGEAGVLTAFNGQSDMNSSPNNLSYNLPGNQFRGQFLIINKTEGTLDLEIIGLLNSRQILFQFNNAVDYQHTLIIDPQNVDQADVFIDNLPNGAHNFIFVAIDRQNDIINDATEPHNIFFHRVDLFSGSQKKLKLDFNTADEHPSHPDSEYFVKMSRERIFNEDENLSSIKFQKPHTTLYLHVNNPEKDRLTFAVLTFINAHQSDFRKNSMLNTDFWQVSPKSLGSVPIEVDTKAVSEGDIFMVLYIENPNINLETKSGEMVRQRARIKIPYRSTVIFD